MECQWSKPDVRSAMHQLVVSVIFRLMEYKEHKILMIDLAAWV